MPERERGIPKEAHEWKTPDSEEKLMRVIVDERAERRFERAEDQIILIDPAEIRKSVSEIDTLISTGDLTDEESIKADDLRRALTALSGMRELGVRESINRLAKNKDQLFTTAINAESELKLKGVISHDVYNALLLVEAAVNGVSSLMEQASLEESKKKIANTRVS